jgi:dehydrogenase/reductase SDR family member 12
MFFNKILDASIVYSFDKRGYLRHESSYFDPKDIPHSVSNKNIVITGGTGGIGRALVKQCAKLGFRVWLCCRNLDKAESLHSELLSEGLDDNFWNVIHMDLSDLTSVKKGVRILQDISIDVLIHNAGILPTESAVCDVNGFWVEKATIVNLIAPYMMNKILEESSFSKSTRVIWISSGGMYPVKLNLSLLQSPMKHFNGVQLYAQTKRAEVILAQEVAKDNNHISLSMHPGWVDTEGVQNSIPRFYEWSKKNLRTTYQGADTMLWLSVVRESKVRNGGFYFDRDCKNTYVIPFTKESSKQRIELLQWLDSLTS